MAEWVTAIGTVGTFVVIAASAIAALLQLQHVRSGNQIAAYNECRETMESVEFRDAFYFIESTLPERLKDPKTREEIVRTRFSGEYRGVRLVANLFESMGLFVRSRMMDEQIACELWSGIVLTSWYALSPVVPLLRRHVGPGVWVNFEYMAVLSKRYTERFPGGEYPRGMERMPLDDTASPSSAAVR